MGAFDGPISTSTYSPQQNPISLIQHCRHQDDARLSWLSAGDPLQTLDNGNDKVVESSGSFACTGSDSNLVLAKSSMML